MYDLYNYYATTNTNNAKIEEIKKENNELIITLTDIDLRVENSLESIYKLKPEFKLKDNLLFLQQFYESVSDNCRNLKEECKSKLQSIYSEILIEEEINYLKIELKNGKYGLKAAINTGLLTSIIMQEKQHHPFRGRMRSTGYGLSGQEAWFIWPGGNILIFHRPSYVYY